jgi:hypothetical protein
VTGALVVPLGASNFHPRTEIPSRPAGEDRIRRPWMEIANPDQPPPPNRHPWMEIANPDQLPPPNRHPWREIASKRRPQLQADHCAG